MNHYDILVIGGGPGGMGAALRAAELGRKTALVERAELGGVCLNWGCIPTKALLKSAQVYHYCRTADAFGVTLGGEAKPDMARIVARSRGVSETMRKGVGFLLEKNKVDVLRGEARLAGEGRVIVADETVSADHIILATGARPREMSFMPIDHEHVLSSRDALVLDELPESMVVVGSGAIGCEFASFYAALGVRVTVVEYLPQLMPLEDEEVARTMERAFRKQRIAVMTSTTVKSVTVDGEGRCRVRIEGKKGEEELTADKVLSAVGIKANIEGLGLEELGVRVERDTIAVDEHYRTNVEGVDAGGDIVPGPALAHVASAEALHCVEHICGVESDPVDYSVIPSCVFTSPEVASVGLTEREALAREIPYTVGRYSFMASGKAAAAGERDGFVKLLFDADRKLIGAHLVGASVTEMLAEPTLACRLGATARQIARTIHAHPTMNEGVMEAAAAVPER